MRRLPQPLAEAVAKVPGLEGSGALLTMADASLTVRLSRDLLQGSTVWIQELDEAKPLRHATHIDVAVARQLVKAPLEAAIAAGGCTVDDSHAAWHWTLADRAGNRRCICAWPDLGAQAGT